MKKNVVVSLVLAALGGVGGFVAEQLFTGNIKLTARGNDDDDEDDDKPRMKDITEEEQFTEDEVEVEDKK